MDDGPADTLTGLETPGTDLPLPEWIDNDLEEGKLQISPSFVSDLDQDEHVVDTSVRSVTQQPEFDLVNLDAVISEAASSNGTGTGLQYPWQQGIMASIFGESKESLLPQIDMPVGYFDPISARSSKVVSGPSIVTSSKTVFESCVQFGLFRTKLEDQDVQLKLAMMRWEAVIMHCPRASAMGRYIEALDPELQIDAIRTSLGGRSISTLRKRVKP